MEGFLVLKDSAPHDTGANMGGTASSDNTLEEEGQHEYGDAWINLDPYLHWRECACGAKTDMTEHTFTWMVDKEPTPTETGLKHEECTECGFKRAAVTTYYEDPNSSVPADPDPSAPAEPKPTQPVGGGDQNPGNGGLITGIIIGVILVAGAVVLIALKKKKK